VGLIDKRNLGGLDSRRHESVFLVLRSFRIKRIVSAIRGLDFALEPIVPDHEAADLSFVTGSESDDLMRG
jgi:hypothetical protein